MSTKEWWCGWDLGEICQMHGGKVREVWLERDELVWDSR